jgi:ATP-dependent DNA helicase RecG
VTGWQQTKLRGVLGGRTAGALERGLGLTTVGDLIRHYPRRYAERGELTAIAGLRDGDHVTIVADVASVTSRRMRAKKGSILEVLVSDGTDSLTITFFNQPWRERELRVGDRGLFAGTISTYRGARQLAHPQYMLLSDVHEQSARDQVERFAGAIIPVYRSAKSITSWQIQASVELVLASLAADSLPDPIPADIRREADLVDITTALEGIHRPSSREDIEQARRRLAFEEAFILQSTLVQRRGVAHGYRATVQAAEGAALRAEFDTTLPFQLTDGQIAVGAQISADLAGDVPMQRLLQGDVGSGKTVVALRAMLDVVAAGGQAVLLAPTEVLASQHASGIRRLLGPMAHAGTLLGADRSHGTSLVLLTGSARSKERREALDAIASGQAGLIVGTHALLEESVGFDRLGLVVIDEQHRFGVEQRAALAQRAPDGTHPHVLVMTATPIPRTVAMTVFGDLDISTLTEVPQGRAEVTTHVVDPTSQPRHIDRLWQRAEEEIEAGHRVFVVCPRIDAKDVDGKEVDANSTDPNSGDESAEEPGGDPGTADVATVEDVLKVARTKLPGARIEPLHGRMSGEEKDAVMSGLTQGTIDLVVSTTVIEVGVDVPDATMMIVFDADRFGISQLHQLRGRIGRGSHPGVCLLVSAAESGSPARERLDAVASTRDGFELAQRDLEIRREGDVLGGSQSGARSSLRLLRVVEDADMIEQARQAAEAVIAADPELLTHPDLRAAMTMLDAEQAEFLEKA